MSRHSVDAGRAARLVVAMAAGGLAAEAPGFWGGDAYDKVQIQPGWIGMATGDGCGAGFVPPAPDEPQSYEVFEMTWPTAAARAVYDELGFLAMPLYTWPRCCEYLPVEEGIRFVPQKFADKLWTPPCEGVPEDVVGRICGGIPPGWDRWVDIDLEAPFWTPIKQPENFTPQEQQAAMDVFVETITAMRLARPDARLAFHNLLTGDPDVNPLAAELQCRLAALSDGAIPSMYLDSEGYGSDQFWQAAADRMSRALAMKAQLGIEIYPIVWKKWRDIPWPAGPDVALLPEEVARELIAWLLDFNLNGWTIDGIFIFCTDESREEESDIAFAQIIHEEIELHLQEIAEGQQQDDPQEGQAGEDDEASEEAQALDGAAGGGGAPPPIYD